MSYVDGCVLAVPTAKRDAYRKWAEEMDQIFKDHGALQIVDCWGDDVPDGDVTSFPMAVKCEPDETVCFSWILWPSKEIRDAAWEKAMADPRMDTDANPMPFDGSRMIFGGFDKLLEV